MVHIALVGASSGFGRTLLRHFVDQGKHQITVLSRSENPSLTALGVTVKPVDYTSHTRLTEALKGVHTTIVTLASFDDTFRTSQLALIEAAKEAGVKRFAPSEYAHTSYEGIDLYKPKKAVWEAVQKSGMEYTKFACGLFMNFLATGTPKGETEALAGMRAWNFVINMKAGTADLPGDGSSLMTVTEINDICRFIVESVDLDHWDEVSGMAGETLSWNEIIAAIEKVTGRKMLVKHNSKEKMEQSALDPSRRFYEQCRLSFLSGAGVVPGTLNEKLPDVQPISVEGYLERWWKNVELPEASWEEDRVFGFAD